MDLEALLLKVTIPGKHKEDMYKTASAIRNNIENEMFLYTSSGHRQISK